MFLFWCAIELRFPEDLGAMDVCNVLHLTVVSAAESHSYTHESVHTLCCRCTTWMSASICWRAMMLCHQVCCEHHRGIEAMKRLCLLHDGQRLTDGRTLGVWPVGPSPSFSLTLPPCVAAGIRQADGTLHTIAVQTVIWWRINMFLLAIFRALVLCCNHRRHRASPAARLAEWRD